MVKHKRRSVSIDKPRKRPRLERNEAEKAEDERIFIEITSNGERILPNNIDKYTGRIYQDKTNGRWCTVFKDHQYIGQGSHETRKEARAHVKEMNILHNLPIKNCYYVYYDKYYCELTQNKLMKFSLDHFDLVERYYWRADYHGFKHFYARATLEKSATGCFHDMIMPCDKNHNIDHINRDSLDNEIENLRIASFRTQAINQKMKSANTTGVHGVSYARARGAYGANWTDENQENRGTTFSIKKYGKEAAFAMAVAKRKEMEEKYEHYKIALS